MLDKNQALLEGLMGLELLLQLDSVRRDAAQIDRLLHDDFTEIGRSGRTYTKADILEWLPEEKSGGEIKSAGFALKMLAADVALLTYRSVHDADGVLTRHSVRSSTWKFEDGRWQMIFHQGTPADYF